MSPLPTAFISPKTTLEARRHGVGGSTSVSAARKARTSRITSVRQLR